MSHSSIEPLEARIAPAALTATYAGGKLTIKGDADPNNLSLGSAFGGYALYANTGTGTLNGVAFDNMTPGLIAGPITELILDLGAGDDVAFVNDIHTAKNMTLTAGAGNDTIVVTGSTVGGTFTFTGGTENDSLFVQGSLFSANKMKLDTGAGSNVVTFGASYSSIETTLDFKGGAENDTVFLNSFTSLVVGGAATFALGNGNNTFQGGDSMAFMPSVVSVGGKLSITQGTHTAPVSLTLKPFQLRVGGDLSINTGTGGYVYVDIGLSESTIGGGISIAGSATDEYVNFGGQSLLVGKALTANLGQGENSLIIVPGFRAAALTYTGLDGDDTVSLYGAIKVITGAASIKTGNGENIFNAPTQLGTQSLTVGAGLTYTGGSGLDTVDLQDENVSIVSKGLKTTLGAGDFVFNIAGASLSVIGGLNVSTTATGTGTASGAATLQTSGLAIQGGITMAFASGTVDTALKGFVDVGGGVKLSFKGGGADSVSIGSGAGATVNVKGALTIDEDAGDLLGDISADSLALGAVTVKNKTGETEFSVVGSGQVLGALTLDGGTGASLFTVQRSESGNQLNLHSAVSITSRTAGTDVANLRGLNMLSTLTVKGGTGSSTLALDDSYLFAATTVDLGAGADSLLLEQTASATGNTIINATFKAILGAGGDIVRLGANNGFSQAVIARIAAAQFTLDGGADTDEATVTGVFDVNFGAYTPTLQNFEPPV